MKKLILVLAICLIASPVFAVSVYLENSGGNVIAVKYSGNGSTAATRIRGLAVTLTLDGTGTFTSFVGGSFKTGESTASSRGYGIYPATIVIDSAGVVTNAGTPLAAAGDPGAGGGFGSNNIVLEFGSLYFADANAPGATGTLCSINITPGTATQVVMAAEATYRGGVVMEDGTQSNTSAASILPLAVLPSPATAGTPQPNVTGLAVTLGWTAGANATSYDVSFGTVNPPPFVGNVATTTYSAGTLVQGKTYYASVVAKNSAGSAAALAWSFSTDCLKSTLGTEYTDWVTWGKPSCWCFQRQCRGDINGTKSIYWVQLLDLNALKAAYQKTDTQLASITNGICADLNHSKSIYRVQLLDLNILKSYYQKADASVPVCDVAKVNFWTN